MSQRLFDVTYPYALNVTGAIYCNVWLVLALVLNPGFKHATGWLTTSFFHGLFASFTYFLYHPSAVSEGAREGWLGLESRLGLDLSSICGAGGGE